MNTDKFAQLLQNVRWRVAEMQGHPNESSLQQQNLLLAAFEECQTTLEELYVAEEELRQQNEELAATHEALEAERQRYQDLFEFAPDGYIVTDTKGTIQEANSAASRLLNVSQQFLVGKPLELFFDSEVHQTFLSKLIQLRFSNRVQEWEVCLHPRKSGFFNAALTMTAVRNREGNPIALRWLLRDISDRKRAEAELQESERRFRQLAENINAVFWVYDLKKTETIYISPAYENVWGRTCHLDEGQSEPFAKSIMPEDCDRASILIEKQNKGELSEGEYRIIRPDGAIRWIYARSFPIKDESGQAYRVCGIAEDITTRKQAESALRQQTEREQALNSFTSAIRKTLDLETIFASAAQEITQLLHVDHVKIQQYLPGHQVWLTVADNRQRFDLPSGLGMKIPDVETEISRQLKQFEVAQVNDTKTVEDAVLKELTQMYPGAWLLVPLHFQDALWGSLCLVICDRTYYWSEWEVDLVNAIATQLAIAIQQGQFYQQLSTLNNNLESQVQERTGELQQKIQGLEQLNILKDDFLSTVSHELRTPLATMRMALQMLRVTASNERQRCYIEICETECNREINLVNDLLDLQRLQAESYPIALTETINLQDWVPNFVDLFHSRAVERQHSVEVDIPSNVPLLTSNLKVLERILTELLNNACKYTPAGGDVILCFRHYPAHEPPVTTFTIGNQAEIPAAELSRVFEKFYRVPNADPWKQGGTGLGLSLVQKLVEQLRGTIQVESSNGWTSFIVQFPTK